MLYCQIILKWGQGWPILHCSTVFSHTLTVQHGLLSFFVSRSSCIDSLQGGIECFALVLGQFLPKYSTQWRLVADGRNVALFTLRRLLHATDVRSGSPSTRLLTRLGHWATRSLSRYHRQWRLDWNLAPYWHNCNPHPQIHWINLRDLTKWSQKYSHFWLNLGSLKIWRLNHKWEYSGNIGIKKKVKIQRPPTQVLFVKCKYSILLLKR